MLNSSPVTTTTYTDTGLTNGTTYYYYVAALGTGQNNTSNIVGVIPQVPPVAPANLTAMAGNTQVSLSWAAVIGAMDYNVYRATVSGGPYTKITASSVTGKTDTDANLTNGTAYYYVVTALNTGGESGYSNEATATPIIPPPAPTGLTATPGDQQVSLAWDPVPSATSYNVYRTTTVGGGYALIPGSPFSGTACTDTGLTDGRMYFYEVTAITGTVEGPTSDSVDAMPIAPDFGLSAGPRSVGVTQGASQTTNIVTLPVGGFNGAVSLSLSNAPAGVTGTFSTVDATTSSLSLSVASIMMPGLYRLTVTGTSGSLTHSFTLPLTVAPPAILTSSQVVQAAQTFSQAIGAPVTGTASAQYPAPARYSSQQDTYWLPRWLVTFTGTNGLQTEVDVVDSTNSVSRYYNYALSQQALANNQPAGTPQPQATAISEATAALQAAGLPSDIVSSPTSQNNQLTSPATSAGDLWMVTWPRQFQSVPYRNQQVTVILQAETGAVQALSVAFPSPPPSLGPGSVTQGQATTTALAQLQGVGVQNLTLQVCQQEVVQPNTYWQQGGSVQPQPNVAGQVAWDAYYTDANNVVYEVWVDTNTGAVIGGESYTTAGKRRSVLAAKAKAIKPLHRKALTPHRKH